MKGGKRPGAGRPPGSRNKRTLAREVLMAEAAKSGFDPWVWLFHRAKELVDLGDPKSLREAREISVELLAYLRPRLSTQNVSATVEQRAVIRVPEKSSSIDAWMETYGPMLGALPTNKTEEPN
jgi:hypothetical protein